MTANTIAVLPKVWVAFAWTAVGAVCMAFADFCLKQVSIMDVKPATGFAMAGPTSAVLLVGLAKYNGGLVKHLKPSYPWVLLGRGVFMSCMSYLNFIGYGYNPYSTQVMILQLAPILAVLLSVVWLKETLSKHQMVVAGICLLAIWFIIDPRFGSGSVFLFIPLVAAFFGAVSNVFVARFRDKATPIGFTFYGMLFIVTLSFAIHFIKGYALPGLEAMLWLQIMGFLAVIGLASVSKGFQLAGKLGQTGKVSLMFYLQMPVALVIGIWVYGEQPSLMAIIGAGLIIFSGISLVLRTGLTQIKA